MIVWPLRGVVALAVVLAGLVARRAPQHRPIAWALGACLALDVLRALAPLPYSLELGLSLAPAALSMWVASWVFAQNGKPAAFVTWRRNCHGIPILSRLALAAWVGLAVVADLLDPRLARTWLPALALAVSVVVQGALVMRWRLRDGPLTVAQACALVLLAGDAFGLLGPAGPLPWADFVDVRAAWWLVAGQAALVALALVGIQGAWLASRKIVR